MFTRAIVRPPAPNFAEGLTTSSLGTPDYPKALAQHQAYCGALERCGLTLTSLDADERYPDSCFVEDTAILVGAPDRRGTLSMRQDDVESQTNSLTQVILTRPGASSRTGEVASIRKALADFPALSEIQSPGTLDGGDVCEAGKHFFIGISERTNEAGAQQLVEMIAPHGYTSSFVNLGCPDAMKSEPGAERCPQAGSPLGVVDATGPTSPRILHLKSGLAYLGENRLVVIDALAGRAEFAGYDLVRVSSDEQYAANCVRVNDHVLVAAGYPAFAEDLRELGYQTIALEMTEFQKMDGGLSCLSLRF